MSPYKPCNNNSNLFWSKKPEHEINDAEEVDDDFLKKLRTLKEDDFFNWFFNFQQKESQLHFCMYQTQYNCSLRHKYKYINICQKNKVKVNEVL